MPTSDTLTATTETVEWGIVWPAGHEEICHDERTARILAEDYTAARLVAYTVTRTPRAVTA